MSESTEDSSSDVKSPASRDDSRTRWWTVLAAVLSFRRKAFRKYCCGAETPVARRRLLRKLRRKWNDQDE